MISKLCLAAACALWLFLQQCKGDSASVFIAADFVRTPLRTSSALVSRGSFPKTTHKPLSVAGLVGLRTFRYVLHLTTIVRHTFAKMTLQLSMNAPHSLGLRFCAMLEAGAFPYRQQPVLRRYWRPQ